MISDSDSVLRGALLYDMVLAPRANARLEADLARIRQQRADQIERLHERVADERDRRVRAEEDSLMTQAQLEAVLRLEQAVLQEIAAEDRAKAEGQEPPARRFSDPKNKQLRAAAVNKAADEAVRRMSGGALPGATKKFREL